MGEPFKEMDDMMDAKIKAVNPELHHLLNRVKAVYLEVGGVVPAAGKKNMNSFDMKKSLFIAHLSKLDAMVDTRNNYMKSADNIETIKIKNSISMEFDALTREFDDLNKTNEHEIRTKGSKLGPAELHSRQEVMTTLLGEYQAMFKRIKGFSHETSDEATQAGAGLKVLVKEELMKGTFAGAGIKTQREALTGEHMQKLDLIRRENIEQDAILDEMAKELDELKDIALRIQDELQLQEKMIADLDKKTDQSQGFMDKVNARLDRAADTMNDRATNFCLYGICFIVLLGVAAVIYNMLIKK